MTPGEDSLFALPDDSLLESAKKSGRTIVDAGYEADFVLALLPAYHVTRQEVADVIFERCTRWGGINVIMDASEGM